MVDLHSHILPGLDDGAETWEDSLAMAEDAISDGITHVVATPHANSTYPFEFSRVRAAQKELSARLEGRLTLATGCDFHLSPENLSAIHRDPAPFCINQKDYLLVEFNDFSIPPAMDQALHELRLAGIHPVVTHPERNRLLRAQPERLRRWAELGCYAQVTAGSLAGVFGPGPAEDAWTWITDGLIHFVSTDAHNRARRPLKLKFAYDAIREQFGEDKARALLLENPLAAFEGRPLPHVPELLSVPERKKRKRFLFF